MKPQPFLNTSVANDRAAMLAKIRQHSKQYAIDTGASASVFEEIEQLLDRFARDSPCPATATTAIESKSAPIERNQILEYWLFDGLPLSTRTVFYFGVLEGLFRIDQTKQSRWTSFVEFMEDFRARETALHASRDVGGWLFGGEAEALWEVGRRAAQLPGFYCELGAWLGRSTMIWCYTLNRFAPAKTLLVVDNWLWGSEGAKYPFMTEGRDTFLEFTKNLAGLERHYRAHRGFIDDLFPLVRADIATDGLALLFHDAGHTYAEVRSDLLQYAPLLNDGAFLVVHDFAHPDFPGVRDAVSAVQSELGYLTLESTVSTLGIFRRAER